MKKPGPPARGGHGPPWGATAPHWGSNFWIILGGQEIVSPLVRGAAGENFEILHRKFFTKKILQRNFEILQRKF